MNITHNNKQNTKQQTPDIYKQSDKLDIEHKKQIQNSKPHTLINTTQYFTMHKKQPKFIFKQQINHKNNKQHPHTHELTDLKLS